MRQRRRLIIALAAGSLVATAALACHDEPTTGPEVISVRLAKRATQDPEVTAADPPSAPQDTTLDVEVSGSGFDNGSMVALTLAGVPTEKVRTNSTRYRNSMTLIANITIAADADVDLYDVEVMTARGKRGIGTEMFEVTATQIVTFTFRDGSDLMRGDGRVTDVALRTTYTTDECGVVAALLNHNGALALRTQNMPIRKEDAEACGGTDPRVFTVSFADRHDSGAPRTWDDGTFDALRMDVSPELRTIQRDVTEPRKIRIIFVDKSKKGGGGNGWGLACPGGLEFDEEWGSHEVQVTRLKQQSLGDAYDEWKIEAAPPNDVAACLDAKRGDFALSGYYRVPFQVNVECSGPC